MVSFDPLRVENTLYCKCLWFPPLRLRSGQALRKVREGRGTRYRGKTNKSND
jgi:hypothetical protein